MLAPFTFGGEQAPSLAPPPSLLSLMAILLAALLLLQLQLTFSLCLKQDSVTKGGPLPACARAGYRATTPR